MDRWHWIAVLDARRGCDQPETSILAAIATWAAPTASTRATGPVLLSQIGLQKATPFRVT